MAAAYSCTPRGGGPGTRALGNNNASFESILKLFQLGVFINEVATMLNSCHFSYCYYYYYYYYLYYYYYYYYYYFYYYYYYYYYYCYYYYYYYYWYYYCHKNVAAGCSWSAGRAAKSVTCGRTRSVRCTSGCWLQVVSPVSSLSRCRRSRRRRWRSPTWSTRISLTWRARKWPSPNSLFNSESTTENHSADRDNDQWKWRNSGLSHIGPS